jgi:protein-disulfide isomerase
MSTGGEERVTRKERREQARAERKALEAQESHAQARRKRLIQLGGAAIAAVVVIGVIVAVSTSGSGKPPAAHSAQGESAVTEVNSLLAGIPQTGNLLGDPKAPVTLQYFGDLECPICKEFTLGALPSLINNYVRPGKMKIEYRSMETATREPPVFDEQQTAALAAGKQNLMWYFVELFYHQQGEEDSGYVTPTYLHERAEQVPGLDVAKWEEDRQDPTLGAQLQKDKEAVGEHGFTGTPSFLLGKSGGTLSVYSPTSLVDPSGFETAINSQLKT